MLIIIIKPFLCILIMRITGLYVIIPADWALRIASIFFKETMQKQFRFFCTVVILVRTNKRILIRWAHSFQYFRCYYMNYILNNFVQSISRKYRRYGSEASQYDYQNLMISVKVKKRKRLFHQVLETRK